MPVAEPSGSPRGAAGSRYCRYCGSEIRISLISARGVACPGCGITTPTNGLVRGASVIIARPSELRAFHIGEDQYGAPPAATSRPIPPRPIAPGPRHVRRASGASVGRSRRILRAGWRAAGSIAAVRDLMRDWTVRAVLSLATVAFASGLAVVIVTLLS